MITRPTRSARDIDDSDTLGPLKPITRPSRGATTGDVVTVACKLPHGLLLRCFRMETYDEPRQDGSWKKSQRAMPIPNMQFTIRGTWSTTAGQAYMRNNAAVAELLPGGYALTHNVPREIWDMWYRQNRNSGLVRNRVIFAHTSTPAVTSSAKELEGVKSGMEPLDPQKPAERMPGGVDRRLRLDIMRQE